MDNNSDTIDSQGNSEVGSNYKESLNITIDDEKEDNGIHWGWDLVIDAVVVIALCVAAILAAPVSIIAAIGFGLAAVYVAWTSEYDSNVITDTKRLVTTVSIATLGATRWLGMAGVVAGSSGLLLSGLMEWFSTDVVGLIVLAVIALILWNEMHADDAVIAADEDDDDSDTNKQSQTDKLK